jgi:hypothetical protein
VPTYSVARADWPTAHIAFSQREEIKYKEQIIDIQGRQSGFADDYLYRRFDSARTGRSRR